MTKHLTLLVHRIFSIVLFIGLAWGQENIDRLILKSGQKTESVNFGEKVTIFYNYSDKSKI